MLTKNHAELTILVDAHIAADALIAGHYWFAADNAVGGTGCFIGCLAHSENAETVEATFGLPVALVKIAENIFEALPAAEGKAFFAALPAAIGRDGKDLSRVHWAFLASELRALPPTPSHIQDVIDPVIAGMDLLASGGEWDKKAADAAARAADAAAYAAADAAADAAAYAAADAADAAADAARAAAYAAADAAYAAARATARAADAAYAAARAAYAAADAAADAAAYAAADAARIRQRDTLLALIAAA